MSILQVIADKYASPRILRIETDDDLVVVEQPNYLSTASNWRNPADVNMTFLPTDTALVKHNQGFTEFSIRLDAATGAANFHELALHGIVQNVAKTFLPADLNAGNPVILEADTATATYRLVGFQLSMNIAFVVGDRDVLISDLVNQSAEIPTATLLGTGNSVWGQTGLSLPSSPPITLITQPGQDIVLSYSGGTTDYTAGTGSATVVMQYLRIAQ